MRRDGRSSTVNVVFGVHAFRKKKIPLFGRIKKNENFLFLVSPPSRALAETGRLAPRRRDLWEARNVASPAHTHARSRPAFVVVVGPLRTRNVEGSSFVLCGPFFRARGPSFFVYDVHLHGRVRARLIRRPSERTCTTHGPNESGPCAPAGPVPVEIRSQTELARPVFEWPGRPENTGPPSSPSLRIR